MCVCGSAASSASVGSPGAGGDGGGAGGAGGAVRTAGSDGGEGGLDCWGLQAEETRPQVSRVATISRRVIFRPFAGVQGVAKRLKRLIHPCRGETHGGDRILFRAHPSGSRPFDGLTPAGRASYLLARGGEADGRGGEPPAGGGRAGTSVALRRSCAGGAGGGDRRNDDRAAADAASGPAHLGEHRGGGDPIAGRHLRQRRAEDRDLSDLAAVDDVVSPGPGGF